jgi:hypothetical protein
MKTKVSKIYKMGGQLRYQGGYFRNGVFVKAHWKTFPDNKTNNNRKSLLGY